MNSIYDLPLFITNELSSGPYGPEITAKINQIHQRYEVYQLGADFNIPYDEDIDIDDMTLIKSKNVKQLIDKQATFMFGRTPDIKINCEDGDVGCDNQSDMQNYLNKVLKKNNFAAKLLRGSRDCFIGGRVFVKANIQPEKITLAFIPADEFIYETEPDDVDTLKRVILFYCVTDSQDKSEQRWWRQRYRMDNGHCYVIEDLYDGWGTKIEGYGTPERDTGLDRIPGVVILNEGLSGDVEGESDVDLLWDEDRFYNEMRSRSGESLKKNMDPLVYIMGASPKSFKGLNRRPGAVNDIEADPVLKGTLPNIGQLENGFSFESAYEKAISNSLDNMHQNLGIPDVSAASQKGLITSGKGMKTLYWELITRCDGKLATWKPALEYIAELIIDAANIFPELKKVYGDFDEEEYTVTVENKYALPEDEDSERELDMQEVSSGTRSIKSYLMKWGGPDYQGMTQEQADLEIEQIVKEKRMMEDSYFSEDTAGD